VIATTTDPNKAATVPPDWEAVPDGAHPPAASAGSGGASGGNAGGAPGAGASGGEAADPGGTLDPPGRFPMPSLGGDKKKATRKTPPPVSRIIGNRDFLITITCYQDHATVTPGSAQFRWPTKGSPEEDQALTRYVQQLIERRQASVVPGEVPYRPVIRFQVAPGGLRTYYCAYPPLGTLHVAMMRENLED
jgi:hypothetical protein